MKISACFIAIILDGYEMEASMTRLYNEIEWIRSAILVHYFLNA